MNTLTAKRPSLRRMLSAATAVLVVATVSFPAYGQFEPDIKNADGRHDPNIVSAGGHIAPPPGTYVVEEGDTLWDLSDMFFSDSFAWPILWSFNPQVTNPHWIYPSDLIYLRLRTKPKSDREVIFAKSRYSNAPRLSEVLARFQGFVTERKYRSSGEIAYSREAKDMLSKFDETYVKFRIPKRIQPGEIYTVYRPSRQVKNPVTGKNMGWIVQHLGFVRVTGVNNKKFITTVIQDSYEEIKRGDRITKQVWKNEKVGPVENKVSQWSRILESFRGLNEMGEHDYVIIDKGFKQKVKRGNRFIIRWRGDGMRVVSPDARKDLPWEQIGEIMVIEPFENTSLGIVVQSIQEIHKGTVLEMVGGY